jgi:hypothetical protein
MLWKAVAMFWLSFVKSLLTLNKSSGTAVILPFLPCLTIVKPSSLNLGAFSQAAIMSLRYSFRGTSVLCHGLSSSCHYHPKICPCSSILTIQLCCQLPCWINAIFYNCPRKSISYAASLQYPYSTCMDHGGS